MSNAGMATESVAESRPFIPEDFGFERKEMEDEGANRTFVKNEYTITRESWRWNLRKGEETLIDNKWDDEMDMEMKRVIRDEKIDSLMD